MIISFDAGPMPAGQKKTRPLLGTRKIKSISLAACRFAWAAGNIYYGVVVAGVLFPLLLSRSNTRPKRRVFDRGFRLVPLPEGTR